MTYKQGCQEVIQENNVILGKSMDQNFIQARLPPVSMRLTPKAEWQRHDPESVQKSWCAKMVFLKISMHPNLFSFLVQIISGISSDCMAYL